MITCRCIRNILYRVLIARGCVCNHRCTEGEEEGGGGRSEDSKRECVCDDDCTLVRVDLTLKVNVTVKPVSISLSKTDPAVPLILSHLPYFEGSRVGAKKRKEKKK